MQNVVFKRVLPYPTFKSKKSEQRVTLNNMLRIHWSKIKKTKVEYKEFLKDMFIPEAKEKHHSFTLEFQVLNPTKRTLDAVNLALVAKWIEDVFVEQGYQDDDKHNTIVLRPNVYNTDRERHTIEVIVKKNQ